MSASSVVLEKNKKTKNCLPLCLWNMHTCMKKSKRWFWRRPCTLFWAIKSLYWYWSGSVTWEWCGLAVHRRAALLEKSLKLCDRGHGPEAERSPTLCEEEGNLPPSERVSGSFSGAKLRQQEIEGQIGTAAAEMLDAKLPWLFHTTKASIWF